MEALRNGIELTGTLYTSAQGDAKDKLAYAEQIWDDEQQKHQSEINKKLAESIEDVPNADEEDITVTTDNKLQLKDRDSSKGMGYKILRLPEDGILTQEMINKSNTIYEIRYDFDLNGQTITIPDNCIIKFTGGSISNGKLGVNTTVSLEQNKNCFRNISFSGNIKSTLLASSFGDIITAQILQNILDNTPRDFLNLEVDVPVTFDSSLHILNKYYSVITFKQQCYTSIDDGSAVLIVEGGIQTSISKFWITSNTKNMLNNTGIQINTRTNYLTIDNPRVEFSKIGICFGSDSVQYSSYLTKIDKAWIRNCETGIKISKGLEESWCNGISIFPLDISGNDIGIDCNLGYGNSIYCTNSEIGNNRVGIKISDGSYNIIGNQWNENSPNSIVLEGGFTTFVGDPGIYRQGSFTASPNAAYCMNKTTSNITNRTLLDNTKLVSDIQFCPKQDNLVKDLVSGDLIEVEDNNQFVYIGENGYSLKGLNRTINNSRLLKNRIPISFNITDPFSIILKYNINKVKEIPSDSSPALFRLIFQYQDTKNYLTLVPRIYTNNEVDNTTYFYTKDHLVTSATLRASLFNSAGCIAVSYNPDQSSIFDQFGHLGKINLTEELPGSNLMLDIRNGEDYIDVNFESLKIYNTCLSANQLAMLAENMHSPREFSDWRIIR